MREMKDVKCATLIRYPSSNNNMPDSAVMNYAAQLTGATRQTIQLQFNMEESSIGAEPCVTYIQ